MDTYKNIQIANEYNVSSTAVMNWIEASLNGKNNLQLYKVKGKFKVIINDDNKQEMLRLSNQAKIYKNKQNYEIVKPSKYIYEILNESQIIELIVSLKRKILPTKFTYFNKGGVYWDSYVTSNSKTKPEDHTGLETINTSLDYILLRLREYKQINLVDIGSGNGYPSKILIDKLISLGLKVKYISIDTSQSLQNILTVNLNTWYGDSVECTFYNYDMEYSIIRDILYKNNITSNQSSCNLIMLLGCTIGNFDNRDRILTNLSNSMSTGDLLLIDAEIDSPKDYDLVNKHLNLDAIINLDKWLLNELGITEDKYEMVSKFISGVKSQGHLFKLNRDIDILFDSNSLYGKVELKQGDEIIGHMVHSFQINELINSLQYAQLNISHLSSHPDRSEVFIMCEAKNI